MVLAAIIGFLYFLFTYSQQQQLFDQVGRFSLGHLYISLFLSFLVPLYGLEQGARWILFALLVTFLSDTSAFYFGRSLGRHPLYPAVSPKKTWEGLGGSVLGGGVTAGLCAAFFLNASWLEAAALGLFLGLWQAGGDLFESMLKRSAGIKDSGRILMGHGGLWDRLDALLFNLPLVFLFAYFRGSTGL
ncbi:MAG: phosphatidate cytidylyltransferase [Pseudomonadota bacterium]